MSDENTPDDPPTGDGGKPDGELARHLRMHVRGAVPVRGQTYSYDVYDNVRTRHNPPPEKA